MQFQVRLFQVTGMGCNTNCVSWSPVPAKQGPLSHQWRNWAQFSTINIYQLSAALGGRVKHAPPLLEQALGN